MIFGFIPLLYYIISSSRNIENKINHANPSITCHDVYFFPEILNNNKTHYHPKKFVGWKNSYEDFVIRQTKNNFINSKYLSSFISNDIEIWFPKKYNLDNFPVILKKIKILVKKIMKCDDEPDFFKKTIQYLSLQLLLNDIFKDNNSNFQQHKLNKIGTLFFLSEKFNKNVRIQLIFPLIKSNNPKNYTLSIVRYSHDSHTKNVDFLLSDLEKKTFLVNMTDFNNKNELHEFDYRKYLCEVQFFIHSWIENEDRFSLFYSNETTMKDVSKL